MPGCVSTSSGPLIDGWGSGNRGTGWVIDVCCGRPSCGGLAPLPLRLLSWLLLWLLLLSVPSNRDLQGGLRWCCLLCADGMWAGRRCQREAEREAIVAGCAHTRRGRHAPFSSLLAASSAWTTKGASGGGAAAPPISLYHSKRFG